MEYIQYNDDETVSVSFGKVAELVNENIITIDSTVDYIEWNTKKGNLKSTDQQLKVKSILS